MPRKLPLHPATVATLLAGIAISIVLHQALHNAERARSAAEFARRTEVRVALIKRSFDEAGEAVRAINLLFQSTDTVDDAQFAKFTRPLLDTYPYLQALTWYRFVRGDGRAAYEAERRKVQPGFTIRERGGGGLVPAAPRPLYLVMEMVLPPERNPGVLGYDIWSYAPHQEAAQRSIDTGRIMAMGLTHVLPPPRELGMVMELPVYGPLPPAAGVAGRRAAARGITEVLIDIPRLVEESVQRADLSPYPGVEITLYGQALGSTAMLEVGRYGSLAPDEKNLLCDLAGSALFDRTERFAVAGQNWALRARAREPAVEHLSSTLALLAGLGFTLAAAAQVHGRVRRTRQIETLVEQRTAALAHTSEALRLHARAIEASANAVMLVDALAEDFAIVHVNPAFQRMHGYDADEVLGHPVEMLIRGADDQPGVHELRHALRERREGQALLHLRRKDGTAFYCEVYLAPVKNARGMTDYFVISEYDVTTARQYEIELERRARHDTLTGLPNRVLLADRIERAIAFARTHDCPVWVAALDLDQFKHVNDSLGHAAGDRLLREAGERMLALAGPTDTVARTGDDEFVLLIENCADERLAAAMVNGVLAAIALPFGEGGERVLVTCSAGIAAYPGDGDDADTLVKHAEIAMVRAKEGGRNTVRFYLPSMNERAIERLALADAMRVAVGNNEFELHYQPQVELASDEVVGMESLIRWRHPRMGMLRPDRFIGLAEETGLIVQMGTWALRAACAQTAAWRAAGLGPLRVAVNLSSRQFRDAGLPAMIDTILADTGLAPTCLEIELTESLMMENVETAIATMRRLKTMGVKLSIDDFGTGYSSLSYLKRFPVDVLKIDQSFVRDIEHDVNSTAMVAAVISLSHDLGLRVIAEGVETQAQLDYLRARGCDEVQGYFFSRPLAAVEFEQLLRAGRCMLAR